jgi:hypothetical protein
LAPPPDEKEHDMRRNGIAWWNPLLVIATVAVVVVGVMVMRARAEGDDDPAAADPSVTAPATPGAGTTDGAQATATPAAQGGGTDKGGSDKKTELTSFRFKEAVTTKGPFGTVEEVAEGEFSGTDRFHIKLTRKSGSSTTVTEYLVIGSDVWFKGEGTDGKYAKQDRGSYRRAEAATFTYRIRANTRPPLAQLGSGGTPEKVNGLDATRYSFDSKNGGTDTDFGTTWGAFGQSYGPWGEAKATVWVANGGNWVVRRDSEFKQGRDSREFSTVSHWELTDVNASAIKIEAPAA